MRELIFLLLIARNHGFSVRRDFLFLLVLRIGCVILFLHSLGLPYTCNYSLQDVVVAAAILCHCTFDILEHYQTRQILPSLAVSTYVVCALIPTP